MADAGPPAISREACGMSSAVPVGVSTFGAIAEDRGPLALCVIALAITFVLTRVYTRLARSHDWGSASVAGGVHLHHMAVGIMLILGTGLVTVAFWPEGSARAFVGILFGVGAGLTLDEFALWLYLRDVYWTPEGRRSIDATVVAVLVAALLLFGGSPFGLADADSVPRLVAVTVITLNVLLATIAVLKGKLVVAFLSIFLPWIGLVSAFRLAKPLSLWTKWFYAPDSAKLARAQRRFGEESRLTRSLQRFEDLLGGAPHPPPPREVRDRIVGGHRPIRIEPAVERHQET
jgi:hypothetical protein